MAEARAAGLNGLHTVALDSCVFIYLLGKNPDFYTPARAAVEEVIRGELRAVASVLAVSEFQVGHYRAGTVSEAKSKLRSFLGIDGLRFMPVSVEVADLAARIRAETRLRLPDAIHLATAVEAEADAFVTNDEDFADNGYIRCIQLCELV